MNIRLVIKTKHEVKTYYFNTISEAYQFYLKNSSKIDEWILLPILRPPLER